ncbi:MAG: hypothetical protein RL341_223 [Pseudomonadota bacterium]|jgi:hypothetical protein
MKLALALTLSRARERELYECRSPGIFVALQVQEKSSLPRAGEG